MTPNEFITACCLCCFSCSVCCTCCHIGYKTTIPSNTINPVVMERHGAHIGQVVCIPTVTGKYVEPSNISCHMSNNSSCVHGEPVSTQVSVPHTNI